MTLQFDSVTATYAGQSVFRGISFAVERGDVLGLIGPNGAGKTTMLRMAAGLIRPAAGSVRSEGLVTYFGGEATMPGACRAKRWAALFGAVSREQRPLGRLSRGTRQLEGLCASLWLEDWTLGLFDEPWEGLDPDGARWLGRELERHRDRGASLVVSSHRLHDVSDICTAFGFLARGELHVMRAADLGAAGRRVRAADLIDVFDSLRRS